MSKFKNVRFTLFFYLIALLGFSLAECPHTHYALLKCKMGILQMLG